MLYQEMLMHPKPYRIGVDNHGTEFQAHRPPEFEFNYCISGSGYSITVKGKTHDISAGKLTLITPMADHKYTKDKNSDALSVTVTLGSVFLGEYYKPFLKVMLSDPVIDISSNEFKSLREAFCEIAELKNESSDFSHLTQHGDLYKICACILKYFIIGSPEDIATKELHSVSRIEKAIEYIESNYSERITLSEVSALCGYKESNFCKHFKRITGMTFHSALNKRRIQYACYLLRDTDSPLEHIAAQTGFEDAKTLCRVFKREINCTPTEYRKA